jgi:acetyl esterase/lipase
MHITSEMIDRELRWMGRIMRLLLRPTTPAAFRRLNWLNRLLLEGRKPRDLDAAEHWIPRRDGKQLRIMVYRARRHSATKVPGLLWMHGGGYLIGLPEQDVATYRRLIEASECVVVAPDYRLGLEAPYPAALEDGYDALLWMSRNADALGVRDDQLAVAGMSAGGGLTAALTLYARDRAEVKVAFQMPLYPMIDDRMCTASATDNDAPVWDSLACRVAWKTYLGALSGGDVPIYAAPARATDLRGLPPTCTFVGDLEPFRDETIQYVEKLRAAGVPVAFERYAGAYHGFDVIAPRAAISRRATAFFVDWFKLAVRSYSAPQATAAASPAGTVPA